METQKILLIGGPGTGKTTVINELEKLGYRCFHEVSREVTLEAQRKGITQLFLTEPLLFSEKLLEGRIKQFKKAAQVEEDIVFMDRGIPDVSAYMDYKSHDYPSLFSEANKKFRYDKVFIFPIWEKIYSSDNERYESYEEALAVQKYIQKSYEDIGYPLIFVPKASIEERVEFILQHLSLL